MKWAKVPTTLAEFEKWYESASRDERGAVVEPFWGSNNSYILRTKWNGGIDAPGQIAVCVGGG